MKSQSKIEIPENKTAEGAFIKITGSSSGFVVEARLENFSKGIVIDGDDSAVVENNSFSLKTKRVGATFHVRGNAELKECGEESFVSTATNPRKKPLEVALDVVKDVIATKQAQAAATLARQHRGEERRKILDALTTKQDQVLSAASVEELNAKLAALDE